MTTHVNAIDLARERWPSILVKAGIDKAYLTGKHTACPICKGKDRFRFTDRSGDGDWVCSGHGFSGSNAVGAGKGMRLLMDHLSLDFREAADYVRDLLLTRADDLPVVKRPLVMTTASSEEQLQIAHRLWKKTEKLVDGDAVTRYYKYRGLYLPPSKTLRIVSSLGYYEPGEEKPVLIGSYPCMAAPVTDVNGKLLAVHRTYLAENGEGKAPVEKAKKISNAGVMGGSIKLYDPVNGFIALTEGIETAEAVREMFGWPVWPTISTGFMAGVVLPPSITKVAICIDHDPVDPKRGVRPGHAAGYELKKRLESEGRQVKIFIPPDEDTDFLDVLLQRR